MFKVIRQTVDITIMNNKNRIFRLNKKGMSLTETLCATVLVALVTLLLVTGVSLANKQYKNSLRLSQSQELYATLESLLINELRYTSEVKLSNNNEVDTFFSVTYALKNAKTRLYSLDENGNVTDGYGQLAIGDEESSSYNRLLGNASYTNNLGAKASIYYDKNKSLFTVTLDIGVIGKDSVINKTFNVRAINNVNVEDAS